MLVAELDRKHEDYTRLRPFWDRVDLLRCGGPDIMDAAEHFLLRRPMEPAQTYRHRCGAFSYQNIFGTALGWYGSRLFADPVVLTLRQPEGDAPINDKFFSQWLTNCDRAGTSLVQLARSKWFPWATSVGSVWVLIDLPASGSEFSSEAEQRAAGGLDPYLVSYDSRDVINWSRDDAGNLEWVVVYTCRTRSDKYGKPMAVDRWYVFDRKTVDVWEAERKETTPVSSQYSKREASKVHSGPHALAQQGRVPLHQIEFPEELRFGQRVYPQVLDHLNADNQLRWLLAMGCVPVPVITGDYNPPPVVSETAYLKLEHGATFGYSEPGGVAYEPAARRVQTLTEEIHRQMYLQAQARTQDATAAAQSGLSKEQDQKPSMDALAGFGGVFRQVFAAIATDVAAIRGLDARVDVQGLTFDDDDSAEIEADQAVLDMGIPSLTLKKELWKRRAHCALDGADPATLKKIDAEIDAAKDEPAISPLVMPPGGKLAP